MKKIVLFLLVLAGMTLVPAPALAAEPQPFQYAIVQCSGLGTVEAVQRAEQVFDSQYGYDHQLTTPAQWQGTYVARVNEFAATVGCPQVLQDDGTPAGALTFSYKIFVPWYMRYARNLVP